MQATVSSFDPDRLSGVVVLDDGIAIPFDAAAFAAGSLLHLRPGQRLTVTVTGEGADARVTALRLGTVGVVPPRPGRRR